MIGVATYDGESMSHFLLQLAESEPTSLGVIGALIAVALVVFKILEHVIQYLVSELKRRKNGGEDPESANPQLARIEAVLKDLHEWHAVDAPGQPGVKLWWITEDYKRQLATVLEKIDGVAASLANLGAAGTACRENQLELIEKQRKEVAELRDRVEDLHQQRVADRDVLWSKNNDTTREVTIVTKDLVTAITANSELMKLVREALEVE
jgi:hypothetical protein